MTLVTDAAYGENNLHRVANDAEGTPASDVAGSDTSFDLESGEGSDFPADTFTIFVPNTGEYIFVGNRSGDTLQNLTRDADGDLGGGQAIADEDEVRLVWSETPATQVTDVLDEVTNTLRGETQREITVQLESTDGTHSVTVEDSGGNTIFDVLSNGNWSDGTNTVYDAANTRIGQNLVDTTSIDESIAPTWTGTHTFQQAEPSSGANTALSVTDSTSGDELRVRVTSTGLFELRVNDSSAAAERDLLSVDPASDQVDVPATLNFPDITGTPTMATHDHSEGGMTAIPNGGLVNTSVSFTAGTGIATDGDGSLTLGGTGETLSVDFGDDEQLTFGASDDWIAEYESANTRWRLHDGTNTVLAVDDGTTQLDIPVEAHIGGDLNHDGSNVGFFGTAVASQQTLSTASGVDGTTTDGTLEAIPDTSANDASQEIERNFEEIKSVLQTYGLLS